MWCNFDVHFQVEAAVADQNGTTDKKGRKKKKDNKPVPMSLEEFKQMEEPTHKKKASSDGKSYFVSEIHCGPMLIGCKS